MTKRHFEALAETVRDAENEFKSIGAHARFACALADMCAETNPRFDRARFLTACKPTWLIGASHEASWDRVTVNLDQTNRPGDRPVTDQTPYEIGTQAGRAVASWVEISDSATAHTIIVGYHDGDPEILDMQPSPLSGEWAGESILSCPTVTTSTYPMMRQPNNLKTAIAPATGEKSYRVVRYQQETDQ